MQFEWIDFYMEFADKLLTFKNNRKALIEKIIAIYGELDMKMPKLESGDEIIDIDPFTVFGLFNKGITDANRIAIMGGMAKEFDIKSKVPDSFEGIPVLDNRQASFYAFKDKRKENDINNLWELFSSAIALADENTEENSTEFSKWYDLVHDQYGVTWKMTMGLYWIRPHYFINLDSTNRDFIPKMENMPAEFVNLVKNKLNNLKKSPYAKDYLFINDACKKALESGNYAYKTLPELSHYAWKFSKRDNPKPKVEISQIIESENMYTKEDFLNDVFIAEEKYDRLASVLKLKKNIILQGAPGVGKTFAAKKLAYSIMGEIDENRIEFVQFHQNYSYEDFVMGYKPAGNGFELKHGIFYRFCKKAEENPDKDYYFIIDEINRGNMSKIFGELLMLIEEGYRGTEMTLAYDGSSFSVPKNLYIIGMMNTADRSLAMIDYALRRRFSFFDMEPGFDTEGFVKYQNQLNNKTFDKLIYEIKKLNEDIIKDKSLGKGFCIGHSYFCNSDENKCTTEWMLNVVDYDILPMLREYWFDDMSKVEDWENKLQGVFQ